MGLLESVSLWIHTGLPYVNSHPQRSKIVDRFPEVFKCINVREGACLEGPRAL